MNRGKSWITFLIGALVALPAWAQGNPTARISGRVVSEGAGIENVSVTFESVKLQGTRSTVTGANGTYTSPPLPPGEYTITFERDGYQTVSFQTRASATLTSTVDLELLKTIAEEVLVIAEATQTVSEGTTVAQTVTYDDLEALPIDRTLQSAVALAAGVHTSGPNNAITISGAQSWENLFTLNGVVLNENVRGQPFDLFIEDAIEETTTASAGVSAEFGRFAGGVVTAVTKTGGNDFAGTFRSSVDNEDWLTSNRLSPDEPIDETNETEEATFGGRIVRDRLWFFGAYRDRDTETQATTSILNEAYGTTNAEERIEGKLTGSITPSHQLSLSRIEIDEVQGNVAHGGLTDFAIVTDDGSLDNRKLPQTLTSLNYTGIITQNFFLEATYSEREFTFDGGGGKDTSVAGGTPVFDLVQDVVYNESLFCAVCLDEERNNEQARLKGSYFIGTENAGSHDLVFGGETFKDIRASDNHQSSNDLMVWNFIASDLPEGGGVFPPIEPGGASLLMWLPILNPTQGTDFVTDSLFVNDKWRLNDNWSFNIGLRWDRNDAVNSLGNKVAEDDAFSPRLGVDYSFGPNSPWQLRGSYARYVGAIASTVFNSSSPAGSPATFGYSYEGDPISGLPPEEAVQQAYDWLRDACPDLDFPDDGDPAGMGGDTSTAFDCEFLASIDIPGATTLLDDGLTSTSADEFVIGVTRQLGTRGILRLDYIHREFGDFFLTQRDTTTGIGVDSQGNEFDLGFVVNDDSMLEREYDALQLMFTMELLKDRRLRVGGNFTWSNARGNFDGETGGSGPVTSALGEYPEYVEQRWFAPRGALDIDQRLRLRGWAIYNFLRKPKHNLSGSMLQSYESGLPYSAIGNINSTPFVENADALGYITPPTTVDYYFSPRGGFRTDNITRTDLSLSYTWNAFKSNLEFYAQPELLNLFAEDDVIDVDTTILTSLDDGTLESFNPFTEEPIEGVHWRKGSDFGDPTEEDSLQRRREFRISLGVRFNF